MAHALITATRMASNGECGTVSVRLNKRAKTATHDGCVYKQLFVHAKYSISAYVVQDVEKLSSFPNASSLLQVPVPVALTTKLLVAPLLWVHAQPPQECDVLFLKAAWERALQEHTYAPLRLTKDTSLLRAAPPMLRLHLSPHGAVVASSACQLPRQPEKTKVACTKTKKKCMPKKKRHGEEEEDEDETCKAEESDEIEEDDVDESEEKEDVYEEIEEDDSEQEDEGEEEGDDDNEEGDENEEEEEEDMDDEEGVDSEVDDTLKSDDEEEHKVEKGRTSKRTKS